MPCTFAAYIARSAVRSSSSSCVPCAGNSAAPTLAVSSKLPIGGAAARALAIVAARSGTARASAIPGRSTTNSSPPHRPTRSDSRTAWRRRSAAATRASIACVVSDGVVDDLEPVEVDHHQTCGAAVATEAGERLGRPPLELRPVRQPCQSVGGRLPLECLVVGDHAAEGHHGEDRARPRAGRRSASARRWSSAPPRVGGRGPPRLRRRTRPPRAPRSAARHRSSRRAAAVRLGRSRARHGCRPADLACRGTPSRTAAGPPGRRQRRRDRPDRPSHPPEQPRRPPARRWPWPPPARRPRLPGRSPPWRVTSTTTRCSVRRTPAMPAPPRAVSRRSPASPPRAPR